MIDLRLGFAHNEDLKDDDRQITWALQREEMGFDETEIWSLDITIIKFILPRLEYLRDWCGTMDILEIDVMIAGCYDYIIEDTSPSETTMERINFMFENFQKLWN